MTSLFRLQVFTPVTALALLVSACGGEKATPATQVIARVNKEEISVHQLNFALQRQPNVKPEQLDATGRQLLERLIDQEVAVQKAQQEKLDRDPRVMQEVEAARREIVARAYVTKVSEGVTKPSGAEIKAYYDSKPALFAERRIYSLQEVIVDATPAQVAELQAKLPTFKSLQEFGDYARQNRLATRSAQSTTPAESLPMALLDRFASMKDGQTAFLPTPQGLRLVTILQARSAPVTEDQARPAIEQFLLNERRRKAVEEDMRTIRAAARVEYVGQYAQAASAPAASANAATSAAPTVAAPPEPAASAAIDPASLSRGVAGLK